jgi:(1->4)-alpha-D-glucan 1-alpha-D-glucosylmutase
LATIEQPSVPAPPVGPAETGVGASQAIPSDEADRALTVALDLLERVAPDLRPAIPRATYRLQLNPDFTFADATAIVPYLAALGVSDLYLSPIFRARPGSNHGYDVVAYDEINPELGGRAGFEALVETARRHDLGVILDFVPNHMGIGHGDNAWWLDVLENGRTSAYAPYFDVDWEPVKPELRGKVLIPTLGDHYGVILENGELQIRFTAEAGTFTLCYYGDPFPISPPTYPAILHLALESLVEFPPDDPDLLDLQSIVTQLERLPASDETDASRIAEKLREQVVAKRRLADLVGRSTPAREAIEAAVATINGTPGDPRSFNRLDQLLERQVFRLAYWRVAAEEINYRRFFAINELAAIRQEEPAVFAATHALLLELLGSGQARGVRLDHPDGLWDPAGYARNLQHAYVVERCRRLFEEEGGRDGEGEIEIETGPSPRPRWDEVRAALREHLAPTASSPPLPFSPPPPPHAPLYVVVEKILEHGESLPTDWAVHGTTGYEFANAVTAIFVDPTARRAFDDLYGRVAGGTVRFADVVHASKHLIMQVALASEVAVLATNLDRITEQARRFRDFTLNNLRDALREVIASFPVYRTYLVCDPDGRAAVDDRDRRFIEGAIREAKRRSRAVDPTTFDFLRDVLLQRQWEGASAELIGGQCRFAMKFQQLSGPVMAKGLEDTAFYRFNRLVALNEVGGDPSQFGLSVAAFHRQNGDRARRRPHSLLASSTHDTKRSEDVRARIAVLSEVPAEWRAAVNRWTRINRRHKTRIEGSSAPDRNDEYLLYQTLLGAWPFDRNPEADGADDEFVDRIVAYMTKATREAHVHTTWVNPDAAYEGATEHFVRAILARSDDNPFLADFSGLRRRVTQVGALNALAAQLLKLTAPGVPDVYQGTEVWDLSLVDPDNRRPVDYDLHRRLLEALPQAGATGPTNGAPRGTDLLETWGDGRVKLFVTHRALACRAANPDLFAHGEYVPLDASGPRAENVCAFARRLHGSGGIKAEVIVAVPRLTAALAIGDQPFPLGESAWGTTALVLPPESAGTTYRSVLTGEVVESVAGRAGTELHLASVFAAFPVALMERVADPADSEALSLPGSYP